MEKKANIRIGLIAFGILLIDQISKITVLKYLDYLNEKVILDGFFKFVHWGNTGAAWSVFRGNNELLAVIALVALVILFLYRHHFDPHTLYGQTALGLIFGGIIGNLIDRLVHGHVIDFIYFYMHRRGGGDIGFPAFNAADSAICIGVALIFFLSWKTESVPASGDLGGSKARLNSSGVHEP